MGGAKIDYFLHVLTATNASAQAVGDARVATTDTQVQVTVGKSKITFHKANVGGSITLSGSRHAFP